VLLLIKAHFCRFPGVHENTAYFTPTVFERCSDNLIASGLLISGCAASQVNIYMAGVFHSVLQPRPEMFACKTFFVALAILWSIVDMTSYDPSPCSEPAVRREWRVFSAEENAEWIRVVNVRNDTPLKLVALLKQYLQHNPVLVKIAS
jgi:hypothetical protein